MPKNPFFKLLNYENPNAYNEWYDNEICMMENDKIKEILNYYLDDQQVICDVGCGTGLGSTLIEKNCPYIGIDQTLEAIEYCRSNRKGLYYHIDADLLIRRLQWVNPIFLFSLDYLKLSTIEQYIKKTEKIFIAVHYNKPYLSPTSAYSDRRLLFNIINPIWKRKRLIRLLKAYKGQTYKLLDGDFYYVTIIDKRI